LFSRNQADAQSKAHEAGDIINAESILQLRPVCFDSFHADSKGKGNFLGAVAFSDELERFALARRELVKRSGLKGLCFAAKLATPWDSNSAVGLE
jgi:hypothetical protein